MFYGICMEEHTCEAKPRHINGKVGIQWAKTGANVAVLRVRHHGYVLAE